MKKLFSLVVAILALCSISAPTFAETTVSEEGQYIFNSLAFYIGGVLVAFMAAGFCMLESGLVTNKSVSTIAAKNIGKFALCSIIFFLFGYQMAYGIPEGGYIGSFSMWRKVLKSVQDILIFRLVLSNNVCLCHCINCFRSSSRRIKIWPFFVFAVICQASYIQYQWDGNGAEAG